ncbi:MAG: NADH-quinone oxidoreductase subunit L [Enterobacteriaceae bacterium]
MLKNLLFIIVFTPFSLFILFTFFCKKISKEITKNVVIFFSILEFLLILKIFHLYRNFFLNYNRSVINISYKFIDINNFNFNLIFVLDFYSILMLLVTSSIFFVICLYATWYMYEDKEYTKFFSYFYLFIFSVLSFILSGNFILSYYFWELISFCSYFLIGFYKSSFNNGFNSSKSLIITRLGDVFFIIGVFYLSANLKTFNILDIINNLYFLYEKNCFLIKLSIIFILFGILSKCSQFPFIWLNKAMSGPVPASALIHSSTMVMSGIYVLIRIKNLFTLYNINNFLMLLSVFTIIISSFLSLTKDNIKKILAYSTISQVGYMFFLIGIKEYNLALMYQILHSFTKSLLFLSSGVIIINSKNNNNLYKLDNLLNKFPIIYFYFIMSGLSLTGFPIITSGFYVKEIILVKLIKVNSVLFLLVNFIFLLTNIYFYRTIIILLNKKVKNKEKRIYKLNKCSKISLFFLLVLTTSLGYTLILKIFNLFNNFIIKKNNYLNKYFIINSLIFHITSLILSKFFFLNSKSLIFFKIKKYISKIEIFCIHNFLINIYSLVYNLLKFNLFKKIINIFNCYNIFAYFYDFCLFKKFNNYLIWITLGIFFIISFYFYTI